MRIKRIEKRVWGFGGKTTELSFEDTETGRVYSRVIAGLGWPWGEKPGCIICLAECWDRDHSLQYSPRHLYLLEEFFSQELEELFRSCLKFRDVLCASKVYGNPDSSLKSLWQKLGEEGARIHITEPPNFQTIDMNYTIQVLRKKTSLSKILHFGEGSSLPGQLSVLREEEMGRENPLERFPVVAALAYVLSVMEKSFNSGGHYTPRRAKRPKGTPRR